MDRLESVFVDEDPIIITENNGNFWKSIDGEMKKLKIGEVFQLQNKTLLLSCIWCCDSFQYFTEFSLHIQEHYVQGDIANLKKDNEEPTEDIQDDNVSSVCFESVENPPNLQNDSHQKMENDDNSDDSIDLNPADFIDDNCGHFQDDFKAKHMDGHSEVASDDESKENIRKTEKTNDNNNHSFGQLKTLEFVEGEHYIKDGRFKRCLTCDRSIERWDHLKDHLYTHVAEKNVICPLCLKAFASFAYVRKHCGKVHKKKISSNQIKEAQQRPGGAVNMVKIRIKSNLNETNSMEQFTEEPHESPNKILSSMKCYKCKLCNKHFTQPRYLQKHMRCIHALKVNIHSIIATQRMSPNDVSIHKTDINVEKRTYDETEKNYLFECFECHRRLKTRYSLKKHLKLHSGKKYKCFVKECHRIFAQPDYVMDHLAIVHGLKKTSSLRAKIQTISNPDYYHSFGSESQNVSSYQCYLCKNEYSSKLRLNVHFKNHLNGPFLCIHCGGIYKSADTLRHHMERHQANPVQCPKCEKMYPTRRYMLRHLRIMHATDREQNELKTTNNPKKITTEMFDCEMDQCDGKFSCLSRLKQHLATHNKKLYECKICFWKCKVKSNLNQHMKVHTLGIKSPCKICNKPLSSRYLAEHMRIHAGWKPIQCAICGKSFFNSQRLKRHVTVVHSGIKKYQCECCTKRFLTSDKLLIHRRSHDEKMDFVCEVSTCQKGFYSIRSLRKHSNAHYLEGHSIASLKLETEN